MIEVKKLTRELLDELLEAAGLSERQFFPEEAIPALLAQKHSYAFVTAYGQVIFCCGALEWWENRAEGWGLFHPNASKHMIEIHKIVKAWMAKGYFERLEATVELDFKRGHQWARMLGFTKEAPVLARYRQGQDYALYAFIRKP